MSSRKTVIFLRHGETELNRDGDRFCGLLDPPLSVTGKKEAARAARVLSELGSSVDQAWTSPLERARQTAEMLDLSVTWEVVEDIRELSFGKWEGLTKMDASKLTPALFAAWEKDAYSNTPPDGESGQRVRARVARLVERIHEIEAKTLLLVSHRTFLRFFVGLLLHVEPNAIRNVLDIQTGKIGILELNGCTGTLKAFNL